ncbi:MAG: DNA adenine methylase [Ignavibacteria bacterium]|nr:DNA adenine methylase [Ignavibacteria bacterium]
MISNKTQNNAFLTKFPSTRFQGSKRKIIAWIYEGVKDLKFETCLDGFGGTGVVSYLFKKMNKSVTYNDILKFNYLIGLSLIENPAVKINESDLLYLVNKHNEIVYSKFTEDNFKNIYYSKKENKFIDLITNNICSLNTYDTNVLKYKKAIAFNALFQSSLQKRPFNLFHRKNLYLRNKDIHRNFGNKKTWEKDFKESFLCFINELNSLIINNEKNCYSTNQSIFNIDPYGFELVYLDPPYIRKNSSNETSDYLKCYHFLEGISNYLDWNKLIDYNTINLRFKNFYIEDDFNFNNIKNSFENIFDMFKKSIIVLSYKKGGVPSIETIVKKLKKIKRKVYTKSIEYNYALNKQNGNAKNNREVLIIGY